MAIISFIEKHDQVPLVSGIIQKILKHCGFWDRRNTRAPPEKSQPVAAQPDLDLQYVDEDEFLMAL